MAKIFFEFMYEEGSDEPYICRIKAPTALRFCCAHASEELCSTCSCAQRHLVIKHLSTLNPRNIAARAQENGWTTSCLKRAA